MQKKTRSRIWQGKLDEPSNPTKFAITGRKKSEMALNSTGLKYEKGMIKCVQWQVERGKTLGKSQIVPEFSTNLSCDIDPKCVERLLCVGYSTASTKS